MLSAASCDETVARDWDKPFCTAAPLLRQLELKLADLLTNHTVVISILGCRWLVYFALWSVMGKITNEMGRLAQRYLKVCLLTNRH